MLVATHARTWFLPLLVLIAGCINGSLRWEAAENPAPPPSSGPGSVDENFNQGEPLMLHLGTGDAVAKAVTLQTDGKIVVAGYGKTEETVDAFAIARCDSNGTLDTTFNPAGPIPGVAITLIASEAQAHAVIMQGDTILAVGNAMDGPGGRMTIGMARYLSNGSLDSSFGFGGVRSEGLTPGTEAPYGRAVVDHGSHFYVGGHIHTGISGGIHMFVARFLPGGGLDAANWPNGFKVHPIDSHQATTTSIVLNGERPLVSGETGLSGPTDPHNAAFLRVSAAGSVDKDIRPTLDNGSIIRAMVTQPDGAVVAVGGISRGPRDSCLVMRYRQDLSEDTTFNGGGSPPVNYVTFNAGAATSDECRGVGLQSDGKIVTAGISTLGSENYFMIARQNTNGSLDTTFGNGGIITFQVGDGGEDVHGMAIQADGKIITVGTARQGATLAFVINRTTP